MIQVHPPDASPALLSAAGLREKLGGGDGRDFWRSLDELAAQPEFRELLEREFPRQFWEGGPLNRRSFLRLLGASVALAGLAGCAYQPDEIIVPYVNQPPEITPGVALHFATALTLGGYGTGVVVQSREGRPVKIEGNPAHPASLGATDARTQAELWNLYDPDRSRAPLRRGQISTWDAFTQAATAAMLSHRADGGAGLHILTGRVTSPTLGAQLRELLARFPAAQWHEYEAISRDNVHEGARLAFGRPLEPIYRLNRAKVILSLDADFLLEEPGHVRYARDFIDGRRVRRGQAGMNRLYALESSATITGAMADHRLPLRASEIETVARHLANRLLPGFPRPATALPVPENWLHAVEEELRANLGACVVIPGTTQSSAVHALAHAINATLGGPGRTVEFIPPVAEGLDDEAESMANLAAELAAGRVKSLIVLGGNPVFDAPADLKFGRLMANVPFSVHLGTHEDDTSALCAWHLPQAHELETWSDARAYDGTVTIQQPLIAPLYGGKSAHEVLSILVGAPNRTGYDVVRSYWADERPTNFEAFWRAALHDGTVPGTTAVPERLELRRDFSIESPEQSPAELEIVFRPDPNLWDGRFANNAWLQELSRPITSLTWDNAALVSPALAARWNLSNGDLVELRVHHRTLTVPVCIVPGAPDGTVTLHLGGGRSAGGEIGIGYGFNAYLLRGSDGLGYAPVQITRTGRSFDLAFTQGHHDMEGRDLAVAGTLSEFLRKPDFARLDDTDLDKKRASFYPEYPYKDAKWGMSIDLNACIGCNACTLACQAENNIPVVGKDEVIRGREMHWIRVDSYFKGRPENPETLFQPVPCMHCEKAPCEPVCPVGATLHSEEGLNMQVYNRCVGTRYCSNNCPYKVRRFNFLSYADFTDKPTLKLLQNPEVTVRNRGVMEKCTYCVQRIQKAKIAAEIEHRPLRDGEVIPACAQACPTRAISFGDLNDPHSEVARDRNEPLSYGLLLELNTQPRTTYLARLRNPNPALES